MSEKYYIANMSSSPLPKSEAVEKLEIALNLQGTHHYEYGKNGKLSGFHCGGFFMGKMTKNVLKAFNKIEGFRLEGF